MPHKIDAKVIDRAVRYLRNQGAPPFRGDTFSVAVDSWWLQTPERRYWLWSMLERSMEIDAAQG